jgi:hypothetical protein
MRSVNYIVDITPDFEETQYRVRPIDFDQQSYEGARRTYLAQYFPCNQRVVDLVGAELEPAAIHQYKVEERTLIRRRRRVAARRIDLLLEVMRTEELAPEAHFEQLRDELAEYHKGNGSFNLCRTMGDLVTVHLDLMVG